MTKLRVGINGFGRIGRILFRAGFDKLDIVGINNASGTPEDLAHFLKYDSTHRIFGADVSHYESGLIVNGKKIPVSMERDPAKIPWKSWGAELVFECTGAFKDKNENMPHISAGAKRVIISAPANADETFVYGINHNTYNPEKHIVVSNGSCTTNCLAPVAKVIDEAFGIEKGLMTTVHAYTNDQRVLDATHDDLRRARAAALSMIPTTTGAAKAVALVLPNLKGKIHGMAVRVPTPNVSMVDFSVVLKSKVTVESLNEALIKAANGELKGVLYCEPKELVSIDFNGHPGSSIVDLPSTVVIQDNFAKVISWYDNEVGFSHRMVDLALHMQKKGL